MIFRVTRTSEWDDGRPCEAAVRGKHEVWDYRTTASPEEYDKKFREPWHSRGTEHGYYDGGIKRRLEDAECWVLELTTIDDLIGFVDRHGPVVVTHDRGEEMPEIEIYDDYRE